MSDTARIELTVRTGQFGETSTTVVVPVPDHLVRELMGGVELSDDPFSILLASPVMYGGRGNAITRRREAFKMRRDIAEEIARAMVPALMQTFGVNDERDGYPAEAAR